MYHHIKKLMYTVNVGTPDPRFGNMLLEQFGGANGELAAAMQYSIQDLNCEDLERKDWERIRSRLARLHRHRDLWTNTSTTPPAKATREKRMLPARGIKAKTGR